MTAKCNNKLTIAVTKERSCIDWWKHSSTPVRRHAGIARMMQAMERNSLSDASRYARGEMVSEKRRIAQVEMEMRSEVH